MQTIPIGTNAIVEVISAYAATNQELPAVFPPPSWVIIGGFYMPATADVKLELVGSVSIVGTLALQVRLFDVDGAVVVGGSITPNIVGTTDVRVISGAFRLPGKKVYQVQAQCIGTSGFGIVRSSGPISA